MKERTITVAFFPYGKEQENPYQNLLIQGLEANGVKVEKIPGRKILPLLPLRVSKADVIHMFWPHDLYIGKNRITAWIKKLSLLLTLPILSGRVVVYSAENIASHGTGTEYPSDELQWIQRIIKRCKGIIFMNPAAPEIFKKYYSKVPAAQLVIPHVHYLNVYPNTTNRIATRNQLGLKLQATVFLISGRMQPYKGIETAISAFKLSASVEDILLIAGKCSDPQYAEVLQNAIDGDPRIRMINTYIPNIELQTYFNAADAVILNYQDIPLNPGSVIMAKGFGIRIIAPDVPTLKSLDQGDMVFVEKGSAESLAEAMRMIKQTSYTPDAQSIRHNLASHAPEVIGASLRSFYNQLIP